MGKASRHTQIVLPLLAIYTCLFTDALYPLQNHEQAFFMPVSSVHVGRGIIKLVWGVNGASYQGR